jgi:hypothetical protein
MQTKEQRFLATVPAYSDAKVAKKQMDLLNQLRQERWSIRFPDVYLVVGSPWSYEQDLVATLLACGQASMITGQSGLWVWEVGPKKLDFVEVTVPRHQAIKLPGVVVRRSLDVHRATPSLVRGIRVTNPLRSLVDAGASLPQDVLDSRARQAVSKKLVTWPGLAAEVERLSQRGRRGVGVMRAVLDSYNVTNRFTPSELEIRTRRLINRLNLPQPSCEVVWGKEGEWRLDFYWADLHLCIEVDGWSVHASEAARRRDHRKQNRVTIDGNMVLRYDWFDIVKDYKRTARELNEAFSIRSRQL